MRQKVEDHGRELVGSRVGNAVVSQADRQRRTGNSSSAYGGAWADRGRPSVASRLVCPGNREKLPKGKRGTHGWKEDQRSPRAKENESKPPSGRENQRNPRAKENDSKPHGSGSPGERPRVKPSLRGGRDRRRILHLQAMLCGTFCMTLIHT